MALTNAEKQKRWRERHKALERATTDATERALLEQVERCVDLPDQERVALADRVGNEAMVLLWRAHWLGKIGEKVRTVPQDAVFEARRSTLFLAWQRHQRCQRNQPDEIDS